MSRVPRLPRAWCAVTLALLMVLALDAALAEVSVQDALQRTVTLPQPARRIVSLAPHLTEMLFAAGAGDRVAGTVAYSDYPTQALALPNVGSYTNLDLEAILALRPDLVVAWASGNPDRQVRKLEELGLAVFISEPRRPEDIALTLERLGVLAGSGETARRVAEAFRARVAALRARYRERPTVSVFYEVWNQPLVTLSGEHLVSHLIEACGGRNVFADLPILAPHIGVEAVLAADPEAIVASGRGDERPEWLDDWRRWPMLTAVAHDNLFFVPAPLLQRHGPRIAQGMELLCEHLETARQRLGR